MKIVIGIGLILIALGLPTELRGSFNLVAVGLAGCGGGCIGEGVGELFYGRIK